MLGPSFLVSLPTLAVLRYAFARHGRAGHGGLLPVTRGRSADAAAHGVKSLTPADLVRVGRHRPARASVIADSTGELSPAYVRSAERKGLHFPPSSGDFREQVVLRPRFGRAYFP
jgi:hypothetical protein